MFNFNYKNAAIFKVVKLKKNIFFRFAKFQKIIYLLISLILFPVFLYGLFTDNIAMPTLSRIFGFLVIFFVLYLWSVLKELFFNSKLKNPRLTADLSEVVLAPDKYNLAEFLSFNAAKVVLESIRIAKEKNFPEVNSTILFYSVLSADPKLNFIFSRAILDTGIIKKIIKDNFKLLKTGGFTGDFSKDFQDVIFGALNIARNKKHQRIDLGDILNALAEKNHIFREILVNSGLKSEDIDNLTRWLESLEQRIKNRNRFWDYKNLSKKGSLAKAWAFGYTIALDRFAIDWTDFIRKRGFEEVIGHKDAILQLERILARTNINNALIVGEPGSGRGSIMQALAQKCLFGESLPNLNYKRVVELNIESLLVQIENQEEIERILDIIFREVVSAGNIILVINDFHNFVGQLIRPGIIDISGVLSPYLKSADFQLAAITTYAGLHKYIETNPSILSFFEKVEVSEISERETIILLENLALVLEQKYKKFVTYPAIRDIVLLSGKYLPEVSFPKKAMDLLDEIMVYVSQGTKDEQVLPKHAAKIISEKTQIPIGEIEEKEKEILLNLESLMHQRIINQEEGVREVATAMRRTRSEITIRKGPMGTFLFLGPTGVGKTETAKALAEIYFGSEQKMIRLDMSEFQNLDDIKRLIGAEGEEGFLTTKVRENPFSLVLLDELEKSHPNILNLFLQVFDEGYLNDGQGRKVDFKNCLIIATSNAGYKIILEALEKNKAMPEIKSELLDFLFKEGVFRPEFINRFDAVVVFKSLTKENLLAIAEILLKKLKKNLDEKGLEFVITLPLKEKIVELSYNPIFGAREMRRVIQDKIENVLAMALLSRRINRGDRVEVAPENFDLIINKRF